MAVLVALPIHSGSKRLCTCVSPEMYLEVVFVGECPGTELALPRPGHLVQLLRCFLVGEEGALESAVGCFLVGERVCLKERGAKTPAKVAFSHFTLGEEASLSPNTHPDVFASPAGHPGILVISIVSTVVVLISLT